MSTSTSAAAPRLALAAVAADRDAALIVVGAGGTAALARIIGSVADVVAERARATCSSFARAPQHRLDVDDRRAVDRLETVDPHAQPVDGQSP